MKSLTIRFDDDVYECVKEAAGKDRRSFNMQVNYLLKNLFEEANYGKVQEGHEAE